MAKILGLFWISSEINNFLIVHEAILKNIGDRTIARIDVTESIFGAF